MTREEFDRLVCGVERNFGHRPVALRWRVVLLASIGYVGLLAWLLIVILVATAFFAAMFWVEAEGKIVCGIAGCIILFGGGWAALRVLLVHLPPPEGRAVTRTETPMLFKMLDELQSQLHSAPFHQTLVVPECNAAVVQLPRLGVLGWPKNYLLLGLPLLDGLSVDEIKAVLAHEFAHLSREHGRFSHWLYRLRRSWEDIFKQLSAPRRQGEISLRPLVVRYVDWFWPRFNAHAFVLSRAHEYEADAISARLAGAHSSASALIRLAQITRHLNEKFWPDQWQLATQQAEPPDDVFVRIRDVFREGPAENDRKKWIEEAFRVRTTNSDTHPCLSERLRALKLPEEGIPILDPDSASKRAAASGAEVLLGNALDSIRRDVQRCWGKNVEEQWRARYAKSVTLTHRLNTIAEAVPDPAVNVDSLWDKAAVLLDLQGDESAKPLLRQIVALQPDHMPALFHLGRILLQAGEVEGKDYLERVMAEDDDAVPQACALLHDYYRRNGLVERVREVEARLDHHERAMESSQVERRAVTARDTLLPHGLTEDELQRLRDTLAADPQLALARLAQKQLKYFPKQRLFVLCAYRWQPWHHFPDHGQDRALVSRLSKAVRLPGRVLVIPPSGAFRALSRKIGRISEAEVYRHAKMKLGGSIFR